MEHEINKFVAGRVEISAAEVRRFSFSLLKKIMIKENYGHETIYKSCVHADRSFE
jgi:hypothetical protein